MADPTDVSGVSRVVYVAGVMPICVLNDEDPYSRHIPLCEPFRRGGAPAMSTPCLPFQRISRPVDAGLGTG